MAVKKRIFHSINGETGDGLPQIMIEDLGVYWPNSEYQNMKNTLENIKSNIEDAELTMSGMWDDPDVADTLDTIKSICSIQVRG